MKKFLTRLFGGNTSPEPSTIRTPVADYLVLVQVREGAEPVPMTLGDLLECDTRETLLQRAAEKTEDAAKRAGSRGETPTRPDPADYEGRPIGDYLDALGVPEDTSRYETEEGATTLYHRLGGLRRPKPADPSGADT